MSLGLISQSPTSRIEIYRLAAFFEHQSPQRLIPKTLKLLLEHGSFAVGTSFQLLSNEVAAQTETPSCGSVSA